MRRWRLGSGHALASFGALFQIFFFDFVSLQTNTRQKKLFKYDKSHENIQVSPLAAFGDHRRLRKLLIHSRTPQRRSKRNNFVLFLNFCLNLSPDALLASSRTSRSNFKKKKQPLQQQYKITSCVYLFIFRHSIDIRRRRLLHYVFILIWNETKLQIRFTQKLTILMFVALRR